MQDQTLFLGFRAKRPWVPDPGWLPSQQTGVAVVCSVSDCLSKPPEDWIVRWDFNRAACYDTEEAAAKTIPQGEQGQYVLFAYSLVPYTVDRSGRRVPADVDRLFPTTLPPLPQSMGLAGYTGLGYDVVSFGRSSFFECSPLSCNGMAAEIAVNRYCLIDRIDDALDVARRFEEEQPEPGTYLVIEVLAREDDLPRLSSSCAEP